MGVGSVKEGVLREPCRIVGGCGGCGLLRGGLCGLGSSSSSLGVSGYEGGEMGVVVNIEDGRVIVEWVGKDVSVACIPYGVPPGGAISCDG
jgi:hypothetical protein